MEEVVIMFLLSSYLISNKNEIESVEYIEPLSVSLEVPNSISY